MMSIEAMIRKAARRLARLHRHPELQGRRRETAALRRDMEQIRRQVSALARDSTKPARLPPKSAAALAPARCRQGHMRSRRSRRPI